MIYLIKGFYYDEDECLKTDIISKSNFLVDVSKLNSVLCYDEILVYGISNENNVILLEDYLVGEILDYKKIKDEINTMNCFKNKTEQELNSNIYVMSTNGKIRALGFKQKVLSAREVAKNSMDDTL